MKQNEAKTCVSRLLHIIILVIAHLIVQEKDLILMELYVLELLLLRMYYPVTDSVEAWNQLSFLTFYLKYISTALGPSS